MPRNVTVVPPDPTAFGPRSIDTTGASKLSASRPPIAPLMCISRTPGMAWRRDRRHSAEVVDVQVVEPQGTLLMAAIGDVSATAMLCPLIVTAPQPQLTVLKGARCVTDGES